MLLAEHLNVVLRLLLLLSLYYPFQVFLLFLLGHLLKGDRGLSDLVLFPSSDLFVLIVSHVIERLFVLIKADRRW